MSSPRELTEEVATRASRTRTIAQRSLNTAVLASTGGDTPPALINETVPATFTCSTSGNCVAVTQNGLGHGLSATARAGSGIAQGVRGESLSPTGRGVYGVVNQPTGVNYGVRGDSASVQGYGVFGNATSATGLSYGLFGQAASTGGVGLAGRAYSPTGATMGLRGIVDSAAGTAAVFENRAGGQIISGRSSGLVEKFSVDASGNVSGRRDRHGDFVHWQRCEPNRSWGHSRYHDGGGEWTAGRCDKRNAQPEPTHLWCQ